MQKQVLFFVNPKAGNSSILENIVPIAQQFTQQGWDVVLHPTSKPGEIPEVIAARGEEFPLIVSSGGDGTLHETVAGLMQIAKRPVLGYLPAGTVNDVASTLELPKEPMEALDAVLNGRPVYCDIGRFNDDSFIYVAAFGAFSAVAYSTPQTEKRIWGRLAYLAEGVRSIAEIRPIHARFTVDGQVFEDDLIYGMVCSTTSVGGFRAGKAMGLEVSLSDGKFEVVLVRKVHNLNDLNQLGAALLKRDFSAPQFYTFQTSSFEIEFFEPVPWTLDGEYGGDVTQAKIVNCARAIRIMVPREAEPPATTAEAEEG